MSDVVGTDGRKEMRTECRYGYYKASGCKNADRYGECSLSAGGRGLPDTKYCDIKRGVTKRLED